VQNPARSKYVLREKYLLPSKNTVSSISKKKTALSKIFSDSSISRKSAILKKYALIFYWYKNQAFPQGCSDSSRSQKPRALRRVSFMHVSRTDCGKFNSV